MSEVKTEVIGPIHGADIVPPSSLEQAREFARRSKAENTLRGYRADWNHFCSWCEARHLHPLPASPEAVASYIAECAGRLKVGTIQRRLNAIAEAHKAMGLDSPTHHAMVTNTMKGIRRTKGTAPAQKAPTLTDDIRAMVEAADVGLIGARDRALILLGFAGAFRRSELVNLDIEDCAFGKDGLTVTLPSQGHHKRMATARHGSRFLAVRFVHPVRSWCGSFGHSVVDRSLRAGVWCISAGPGIPPARASPSHHAADINKSGF
jgi:site-specific recombinase XerD